MTMLTIGSTIVRVACEAVIGPAWNASWVSTSPASPATTMPYGSQCSKICQKPPANRIVVVFVNAALKANEIAAAAPNQAERQGA